MKVLLLLSSLLFSSVVLSNDKGFKSLNFEQKDLDEVNEVYEDHDKEFYTIKEVRIKGIVPKPPSRGINPYPPTNPAPGGTVPPTVPGSSIPPSPFPFPRPPGGNYGRDDIITRIDRIVALGVKVWKIIADGKPVIVNGLKNSFSVLPYLGDGPMNFEEMTNWKMPKAKAFKVEYVNTYGITVISFTYNISYLYGGKHNDKGNYISGLSVRASNITVFWGFDFEAQSELMAVVNHGSKDEPMAGASIEISYQAKNIFKNITSTSSFHVMGNGELELIY